MTGKKGRNSREREPEAETHEEIGDLDQVAVPSTRDDSDKWTDIPDLDRPVGWARTFRAVARPIVAVVAILVAVALIPALYLRIVTGAQFLVCFVAACAVGGGAAFGPVFQGLIRGALEGMKPDSHDDAATGGDGEKESGGRK